MLRYGFTGTRHGMTAAQLNWLRRTLPAGAPLHHGGCVGADAQAHVCALDGGSEVTVHPPANPALRMPFDDRAVWLGEKDYLDRDRDIVDATDLLLATPDGPERPKSGTWYTSATRAAPSRPAGTEKGHTAVAKFERTTLYSALDQKSDADALVVHLDNGAQLHIHAHADRDGITTVSVEPFGDAGRVRILVGDCNVFDDSAAQRDGTVETR